MKRALAALVVTAVAVVLLARYETHPPAEAAAAGPRRRGAPAPPQPGVKVGRGPLLTTPFSSIQVRAELTRGRLTGVQTLSLTGADAHTRDDQRARRADPARGGAARRAAPTSTSSPGRRTRARAGSSRCARRSGRRAVVERVEHVMGMPVRVDVRDAGAGPAALDAVFAWLRFVDATFSTYDPRSEISRIGRGALALAAAHPLVREVLDRCEALRAGDRRRVRRARAARGRDRPDRPREGLGGRARRRAPGGGGRAALPRRRRRRRRGARRAVARRDPPPAPARPARGRARRCDDGAVATSGAYERGPHIVDPRTGRPAAGALSVTVVGPDLGHRRRLRHRRVRAGPARPGLDGDARGLRRDDDRAGRPRPLDPRLPAPLPRRHRGA